MKLSIRDLLLVTALRKMRSKDALTLSLQKAFIILSIMSCVFLLVSKVDVGLRADWLTQVVFSIEILVLATAVAACDRPLMASIVIACVMMIVALANNKLLTYLSWEENQAFTALWVATYVSLCPAQLALALLFAHGRAHSILALLAANMMVLITYNLASGGLHRGPLGAILPP